MGLVAIFGWDIDFALDIRQGDRFAIVYEEMYKDDVKIRNGRILSAKFINNGKTYHAVHYTDPNGNSDYFAPDGKSMRKAFLRSPVRFSRISSRFTKKRWHPVLSKWRSHKGVDYAAARGTPVRASGDGKIIHAGTKGGYGRLIVIPQYAELGLSNPVHAFSRVRAVSHNVAQTINLFHLLIAKIGQHSLEGHDIAMDIAQNRSLHGRKLQNWLPWDLNNDSLHTSGRNEGVEARAIRQA